MRLLPTADFIKSLPLALGLPLVIGAASIGPDDVGSNLSKWAIRLGFVDLPNWLISKSIDSYTVELALFVGAVYALTVWGVPFLLRRYFQKSIAPIETKRCNDDRISQLSRHVALIESILEAAVVPVASARYAITHRGSDHLMSELEKGNRSMNFFAPEFVKFVKDNPDLSSLIADENPNGNVGSIILVKFTQRHDRFINAIKAMGPKPSEDLIYVIMERYQEEMLEGIKICSKWIEACKRNIASYEKKANPK